MNIEFQKRIKDNAEQIRSYMSDLYSWQQQMNIKQKAKNKIKKETAEQVRQREQRERQQIKRRKQQQWQQEKASQIEQQKQRKQQLKRDANSIQGYYNAWDSYNIDNQLKRLQEDERRSYQPYNPYENTKNNVRAKPKVEMNVKGGRKVIRDPTSLKDKGNVFYKACDYLRAIQCYTECIQKLELEQAQQSGKINEENRKLKALVLSNRAMTYVKINERAKALQDCNKSIQYDPFYSKSYLRRADCLKRIGKYRDALSDLKALKRLTPDDAAVDTDIRNLQQFLEKRVKEAQKSLVVDNFPEILPDSCRVQISEVEEFSQDVLGIRKQNNHANYLEEL